MDGDAEAIARRCLDHPADRAGWGVLADWYDDHDRPDAATLLRTHAAGLAAVATHLPDAWRVIARDLRRHEDFSWEALCRAAGEALACASRAAGARVVLNEGR